MRSSSHRVRLAAALGTAAVVALGAATTQAAAAGTLLAGPSSEDLGPTSATGPGLYIVTLAALPAAAYDGRVRGFPATRPTGGRRFDRTRPAVVSYEDRLLAEQDQVLDDIGARAVLYRYTVALDGFAARLSASQVKRLREDPRVALVERSTRQKVDALSTAPLGNTRLRTTTAPGLAGSGRPLSREVQQDAGRGTVIAVVDTGIWPENPSFAGIPQRAPGRAVGLPRFHGACQAGDRWSAEDCNDKVISARYFVKAFGAGGLARSEFVSPRDSSGHGSHVASTAAGDDDVAIRIDGQHFGRGSGVAPAARIAVYKACWSAPDPDDDGCETADTVAAVDRAVADGVDVINYSISGPGDTVADSVERAFLNAASAGVFVVTPAGNAGAGTGTVDHAGPWVTTVGASTHRLFQGSVVLGDGTSLVGAMVSDRPVRRTGIVLASHVAAPEAGRDEARLCEDGALDATQVEGRIVVCDRGVTARVDKSAAVLRAGGSGMVLADVTPNGVDADVHALPTVHLGVADAATVKRYIRQAGSRATAALDPAGSEKVPVPQVAAFSSRGPARASGGDLLKPDLTAPGVSVIGAVSPRSDSGRLWDIDSGTSMSAPHVAGLAAYVLGAHPRWSPARVKSAMMTTADDVQGHAGPLAEGAGEVDPAQLLHPGLVYDVDPRDWRGFAAGRLDAGHLNLPSIAVGGLTGGRTVERRVTNVSHHTESYRAAVTGLRGIDVSVRPAALTLAPGQSARFTVRFRSTGRLPVGGFARGWLTWTGPAHLVRSPVVVQPAALTSPREVTSQRATGALVLRGVSGTNAPLRLSTTGLVPSAPIGLTLEPGPFDPARPTADADTFALPVEVPVGTDAARFQMDDPRVGDDLDVFVYHDGHLVGRSVGGSSDATVTLAEPEPGGYTVFVNDASAENRSAATGQLYTWVVGDGDRRNLRLGARAIHAPAGERYRYRLSWNGLDLTRRWFGTVRYGGSGARTFVSVD